MVAACASTKNTVAPAKSKQGGPGGEKRGEGTDGPVDKSKKKNEPKEKKSWLGGKKKKGDAYSPGSPDKGDAPKDKDKDDKGGGGGKSKFSFGGKSKKTAPSN